MTISYQYNVASSSVLGFGKLLLHWRGSVYKLIYRELSLYAAAFLLISVTYRNFMTSDQKLTFERVALYCDKTLDLIPLSFVLGFYVTFVITRWWNQFATIPWPDRLMHVILTYVEGVDDRGRLLRRTLIRYVNLSCVLLFQSISGAVKKRFPTMEHLVTTGFMTWEEKNLLDSVQTNTNKHFVPMIWFLNLANVASREGRIQGHAFLKHIIEEVNSFRSKTGMLWCYDWVTVPLVYTQVVTMVTHLFFVACLFARQYLDPSKQYPNNQVDLYFPFFTFLQFMFFMGWLKVAEQLINPFGEDDDDFETNWIIDRNLQMSYLSVDDLYGQVPRIEKDIYWNSPGQGYTNSVFYRSASEFCNAKLQTVINMENGTLPKESTVPKSLFSCFARITNKELKLQNVPKTLGHKKSLLNENYLNILNRGKFEDDIPPRDDLNQKTENLNNTNDTPTVTESLENSEPTSATECVKPEVILEPEICWTVGGPS